MPDERRHPVRRIALSTMAVCGVSGLWLLGAAPAARAQTAAPHDSLPARSGSYALEGGVGPSSTSLGVLRFFSPRSALGLTLSGSASHQSASSSSGSSSADNGTVTLNLGYRRYARMRDRIAAYGTVGVTTGYTRYQNEQVSVTPQGTFDNVSRTTSGSVGGFGELGATYLVLSRLTVNASALASVSGIFTRLTSEQAGGGSAGRVTNGTNGVGASLGPVRFGLTLFL